MSPKRLCTLSDAIPPPPHGVFNRNTIPSPPSPPMRYIGVAHTQLCVVIYLTETIRLLLRVHSYFSLTY